MSYCQAVAKRNLRAASSPDAPSFKPPSESALYRKIATHVGRKHRIACVNYAGGRNVAVECESCGEVIVDENSPAE